MQSNVFNVIKYMDCGKTEAEARIIDRIRSDNICHESGIQIKNVGGLLPFPLVDSLNIRRSQEDKWILSEFIESKRFSLKVEKNNIKKIKMRKDMLHGRKNYCMVSS